MRRNRTAILPFARLPRWREAVNFIILMPTRPKGTRDKTATVLGLVFLGIALLCVPVSSAQQIPFHMELFGGYSYVHFDSPVFGFADYANLNGGNLSLSIPHLFHPRQYHALGVVVDTSANYGSHLTVYNFMAGPQLTVDKRGLTFFVRGLFGKSRERFGVEPTTIVGLSSLGRAFAFGGGVQKNWQSKLAVRILQVDYINNDNFSLTQNNLRISTGLVYEFGGK
jgi:hypothetical protein